MIEQETAAVHATIPAAYFDPEELEAVADRYRSSYQSARPFPHVVIDNFLPEDELDRVLDEFLSPKDGEWQHRYETAQEKKLAERRETRLGPFTRHFLAAKLNSSVFLEFLESLTGIQGLIPDPYYEGGGLHQIERGGFLKVHADFNWHEQLKLDRRLNLLVYLNRDWKEEYGGNLELWNRDVTKCEQKILPIFNRCVVFSTTDYSYHGHPEPLQCPEAMTRKSLALYYYSNGRPAGEISEAHTTLFQARPGEVLRREEAQPDRSAKTIAKKLIPPIVLDGVRALQGRRNKR